jgi:Uncharacterised nucleotidyltransferase
MSIVGSAGIGRRAEIELLVMASRPYTDQAAREKIASLASSSIDWQYVRMQAARHGISALVYFNLCSAGIPRHTADIERLARMARASANRSLYLLGELVKILAALEDQQIAAIPLKGPVLAVTTYGDVSRREFSDLDILIQERDIARARDMLASMGFRCAHHNDWIEPYLFFGHELDFVSNDGTVQVDLQWRFAKKWLPFPVDPATVWDHSVGVTVAGHTLRQPSLEDSLLILCGHGYRHCWSRLKWIVDISAFLQKFGNQIDEIKLFEQARKCGGLRLLALGLWLAQELGGSHLPPGIRRRCVMDSHVQALERAIVDRLFDDGPIGPRGSFGLLSTIAFHLRARERFGDKLPILAPLFFHGA